MIGLAADAWAVWLAIRRAGRVNGNIAQLAQESGIAPAGVKTTAVHRGRATDALTELEDAGYIARSGSTYRITRTEEL